MKSQVSLLRCDTYEKERVFEAIHRLIEPLGGMRRFVSSGQKVLIKPNMLAAKEPERGITTHPVVMEAVIREVQALGAETWIGDSPSGAIKGIKRYWENTGYGALARETGLRTGRRLSHVEKLVPVPNILLAGTYGVEMRTRDGRRIERVEYGAVRPALEQIKPQWAALIEGRQGFYLEDKGWSLAMHARFAGNAESAAVLAVAEGIAVEATAAVPPFLYRLLGGQKFLEIGPQAAHKGRSVEYLLERYPWPGALPVFLGDDDKDEEAFAVVQAQQGVSIVVAETWRPTRAAFRLESPRAAREWLRDLGDQFAAASPPNA